MRTRDIFFAACLVLCSFTLFGAGGCAGPRTYVDAGAINGTLRPILDRHDAYVTADATLDPTQRSTYLMSSTMTRAMLDQALKPAVVIPPTSATGRTR